MFVSKCKQHQASCVPCGLWQQNFAFWGGFMHERRNTHGVLTERSIQHVYIYEYLQVNVRFPMIHKVLHKICIYFCAESQLREMMKFVFGKVRFRSDIFSFYVCYCFFISL